MVTLYDSISDRITCDVSTVMSLTPSRMEDWGRVKREVSEKQEQEEEGQDSSLSGTVCCYVKRRRK